MSEDLMAWASPQLARILPLDQSSLNEILTYADSLPKDASAEHLKNLLGDSSQALDFISSFNQRRNKAQGQNASPAATKSYSQNSSPPGDAPQRSQPRQSRKKQNIHALPARQVQNLGNFGSAYVKQDEQDYMPVSSKSSAKTHAQTATTASSLSATPVVTPQGPIVSGPIVSATGAYHAAGKTPVSSRPSSPAQNPSPSRSVNTKTKVTVVGGKAMHGASTALSDLDSAIRALEIQTNPLHSSSEDDARRQCSCMATQHPLLTTAPNCLKCGKIICVKQGLGPCTFCKTPLLSSDELHSILRVLKDERGKERQVANNAVHKRAEVSQKPKAFSGRDFLSASSNNNSARSSPLGSKTTSAANSRSASPGPADDINRGPSDADLVKAREHRDKLLDFQSQNAKRTRIHDEAADYAMPVMSGDGSLRGNIWASPAERALELKRQQKVMREMEFNSRPEWEKKKVVGSIDISSGKIVKRFVKEKFEDGSKVEEPRGVEEVPKPREGISKGAFGKNPLLGAMIRPVWRENEESDQSKGKGKAKGKAEVEPRKKPWRRVQDDLDDNEAVILDGGIYGRDIKVA